MSLLKSRITISIILLMYGLSSSGLTHAGPYAEELGNCLANNTTGKDRTDLVRWILSGIALHPAASDISSINPEIRDQINKNAGSLFTHLIAESCNKEFMLASKNEGAESFKLAFEFLGKLAMQELMANPKVAQGFGAFAQYVDEKKIKAALDQ